ncbi:MAG: malectin, partial [Planctomycetes bacterium]|nr:malectin [Planctomycetota bacterium]
ATCEQWSIWGQVNDRPVSGIQRVGINLGAPGDRMTPAGTLWLDHPSVGGPSPVVSLRTEPAEPSIYYRHSLFLQGGHGWPWVGASGAEGLSRLTLEGLKPGTYSVRLYFAEPAEGDAGSRTFDVQLQGKTVLEGFDVARDAGGALRVAVRQFDEVASQGALDLRLIAENGRTLLNGIEVVATGMTMDEIIETPTRIGW